MNHCLHSLLRSWSSTEIQNNCFAAVTPEKRQPATFCIPRSKKKVPNPRAYSADEQRNQEQLVVVGGGAAGVYGAIWAKTSAPNLNVVVIEKRQPLSKVKISGGGRCNVTNGHCDDKTIFAEHYPRGYMELRRSFFHIHGPEDTMTWFSGQGVELKIEDDGRVFPLSDCSSSVVDCLLSEAKQQGVVLQVQTIVKGVTKCIDERYLVEAENCSSNSIEHIEADYVLIASGSSRQGYNIANNIGHSIVEPLPSLFTFKIDDSSLLELAGVGFTKVKVKLKLENIVKDPHLVHVGPLLVTHWGFSGPVILRLSAWGARHLFDSDYRGTLIVDFAPDMHIEKLRSILLTKKTYFAKHKLQNICPSEFKMPKRFWKYMLDREGVGGDRLWGSMANKSLNAIGSLLKQCPFEITGKGQFKEEFVTAGGVPLSEVALNTMESKIHKGLFFAGEVLNIDGETGGYNFQNAWSGGYIAGTTIGSLAQSKSFG